MTPDAKTADRREEAVGSRPPVRTAWLDELRLLACLAVVAVHVSGEAYARFGPIPSWEWWLANFMNGSSRAGVPVFAMISGALMNARDSDPATFYRKKFVRFLPVVVVWTLFYGTFDVVAKKLSIMEVVRQFVANGYVYLHLWYLSMYVFLLLLIPYLAKLRFSTQCGRRDWLILVGLGVSFSGLEWSLEMVKQVWGITSGQWTRTFLQFIPYVMLGSLLSNSGSGVSRRVSGLALGTALVMSWAANFLSCRYLGIVNDALPLSNSSPLVLAVAVAVFLFAKSRGEKSANSPAWLALLGQCSLGIYLLHPFFIWLFRRLCRGTEVDLLSGGWMVVTMILVFAVSLGCTMMLRKFPLGRKIC